MTPEELRDIDRRIAVAKGWTQRTEGVWVGAWVEPGKTKWLGSRPPIYTTDPAEALGLLREMVEREVTTLAHSGLTGKFLADGGSIQAATLETAIALAWLALFEKEETNG